MAAIRQYMSVADGLVPCLIALFPTWAMGGWRKASPTLTFSASAAKARLSVYSNLSPTERAQLLVVAAAAHQNLSEYMLHAVVTDAYALLGTAREGGA